MGNDDKEILTTLGKLIDQYNEYLNRTGTQDQLNIHSELSEILRKLEYFLSYNE